MSPKLIMITSDKVACDDSSATTLATRCEQLVERDFKSLSAFLLLSILFRTGNTIMSKSCVNNMSQFGSFFKLV